jgi:hypothetical protein
VGRLLLVLLVTLVVVEVIVLVGVAVALFLLGATETILFGAGMLLLAGVAGLGAMVAVRPRRGARP